MSIKFTKNFLLAASLLICISCAKEIYTDEDAAKAQREAQKVGLTVMIKDIDPSVIDLSGFMISSSQCGQTVCATTPTNGWANLMLFPGDAVLLIEKSGYSATTAIVTLRESESSARTNTVVVVPVFSETAVNGTINGTVTVPAKSSPVANALVSVNIDFDALMAAVFSGLDNSLIQYRAKAMSYSTNLMKPVTTDADGHFRLTIPATTTELAYTVMVHQTEIEQDIYNGSCTITTNGKTNQTVNIQLTPYTP